MHHPAKSSLIRRWPKELHQRMRGERKAFSLHGWWRYGPDVLGNRARVLLPDVLRCD